MLICRFPIWELDTESGLKSMWYVWFYNWKIEKQNMHKDLWIKRIKMKFWNCSYILEWIGYCWIQLIHVSIWWYCTVVNYNDMNNDDLLDIVNVLLISNNNGTFPSTVLPIIDTLTISIALGDFNGDNVVEVVIGTLNSLNRVFLKYCYDFWDWNTE